MTSLPSPTRSIPTALFTCTCSMGVRLDTRSPSSAVHALYAPSRLSALELPKHRTLVVVVQCCDRDDSSDIVRGPPCCRFDSSPRLAAWPVVARDDSMEDASRVSA